MDDRQTQIREGAGLEESKLNVEFIEWLRRWSTPIIGLVAVVALGFVGVNYLKKREAVAVDKAFAEFADAADQANPSPSTLQTVAEENAGVRGVPLLAQMRAADVYFRSARSGVKVGAQLKPDGAVDATEVLTDDQRTANLAEAEKLYQKIYDATSDDKKKAVHALAAAYGLAAVAESRGNAETAKQAYEKAIKIAEYGGLNGQAAVAKKRIESLPQLGDTPKLLSAADLPKPPEPPKAPTLDDAIPSGIYTPVPDPAKPGEPTAPGTTPPATTPPSETKPGEPATATPPPAPAPTVPPAEPKPGEPPAPAPK